LQNQFELVGNFADQMIKEQNMTKQIVIRVLPFLFLIASLVMSVAPADAAKNGVRRHRTVVDSLPRYYRPLHYCGVNYFWSRGIYYRRAPSGYVIIAPPLGIVVPTLPVGYVTLTVSGSSYFYYQDVYYQSIATGYEVVEKPVQTVQIEPVEPAVVGDKFAVTVQWLICALGRIQNIRSGKRFERGKS